MDIGTRQRLLADEVFDLNFDLANRLLCSSPSSHIVASGLGFTRALDHTKLLQLSTSIPVDAVVLGSVFIYI